MLQTIEPSDTSEPLCLVREVRNSLFESGLGKEVEKFYDTDNYVKMAIGRPPEAQRTLLNRFWNLQLIAVNKNSIEERYCLIPTGDVNDWLRLFRGKIIPFLIEHRLPNSLA